MQATHPFPDNAVQPIVDALRDVSCEFVNVSPPPLLLRFRLVRAHPPGASCHCHRQAWNLCSVWRHCAYCGCPQDSWSHNRCKFFWYFMIHHVYILNSLFFVKSRLPLLWSTWFPLAKRVYKPTSPTWISLWATALNCTCNSVFQVHFTRQSCPYVPPFKCGDLREWLGKSESYVFLFIAYISSFYQNFVPH